MKFLTFIMLIIATISAKSQEQTADAPLNVLSNLTTGYYKPDTLALAKPKKELVKGVVRTITKEGREMIQKAIATYEVTEEAYLDYPEYPVNPDGSVFAVYIPPTWKKREIKRLQTIKAGWNIDLNKWYEFIPQSKLY